MSFIKNLVSLIFIKKARTAYKLPKTENINKEEPRVEIVQEPTIKETVFYLGSLEVFMLQTQREIQAKVYTGVYWRDAASPQGYGPFLNLHACMEHYAWISTGREPKSKVLPAMPSKLIRVDFQSKKVVKTPER